MPKITLEREAKETNRNRTYHFNGQGIPLAPLLDYLRETLGADYFKICPSTSGDTTIQGFIDEKMDPMSLALILNPKLGLKASDSIEADLNPVGPFSLKVTPNSYRLDCQRFKKGLRSYSVDL